MKRGVTLFVHATAKQAKDVAAGALDGRPEGWTEEMALRFIAEGYACEAEAFAQDFCEGDWLGIKRSYPGFADFVRSSS